MRNAGLEEAQAGIKIARRNIKNLRYADDTTLMAESEEELKSLLMKVKEESEKVPSVHSVTQSCLTLSDLMDCSLPGSSIHGFSRQEHWSGVPLPSLNMLSRLVITFLPRSKHLLISWLQSSSAVILEPPENKV